MVNEDNEQISAENVIEIFHSSLEELKETNDYLSYATVVDVHLSNPERFTDEEKCDVLKALHDILESNLDIVKEIGWDLPEILMRFFYLDWDYSGSLLRDTDCIKLVMANFDVLAKNGNAKELFIKSIELLSSLDYADNQEQKTETILDLKYYVLTELLASCLKRINTVYPSKFLAMALTCLLSTLVRYLDHNLHQRFIVRRLYSFARDYLPPLKPLDYLKQHGLTQEEANKLDDDENYLQRKLLQSFMTQLVGHCFKRITPPYALELYSQFKKINMGKLPLNDTFDNEEDAFTSSSALISRLLNLSMSFDFDFINELNKLKKSSVEFLAKIDNEKADKSGKTRSDDDKIQDILKLSLEDKISHMYNPGSQEIPMNLGGILSFTVYYSREQRLLFDMNLKEAIAISLRFLSPGLVAEGYKSQALLDAALYWCWGAIKNSTSFEEMETIPKYQITLFLQVLMFYSSTEEDARYRFVIYTLLVRILTMIDENISYDFLIDTLAMAPYENTRAASVNVLKDLMIRERPISIDRLTRNVEKTCLNDDTIKDKPSLPKRTYIDLTKDREDDLYALIRECIDETFAENEVNSEKFKTLLGYLNFLIVLKRKFSKKNLKTISDITSEKISKANKREIEDPCANLEFATIALASLNSYLNEE